jgi:competence protein ComEA
VPRPTAGCPEDELSADLDKWGPLRDFVRDRLPESVRGARLDPGVRGALALAALALTAAAVALILAWTSASAPAGQRSIAPLKVAVPALSSSASGVPSTPATGIEVDVGGKVRRPGLVKLMAGARVADAVAAAGGVLPGTSMVGMSLARKLIDGEQLLVGEPSSVFAAPGSDVTGSGGTGSGGTGSGGTGSGGTGGALVDLNTATVAELDALPGIGPVLAQRILTWRTQHGSFTSVDQLHEVTGVGDAKFADLSPLVRV